MSTVIDKLFKDYETRKGKLLFNTQEKQYFTEILNSIYDFSFVIGMQECFEKNFDQVLFCVKNSNVILDCLNPNSRYCPDMQKAVKLFILIIALQNKCTVVEDLEEAKLTQLVDIKNIEIFIEEHLRRDRSTEAALIFFSKILNSLVFGDKQESYIEFKKEDFDIDEILVTESALMSVLGSFQLARELEDVKVPTKGALRQFFKLYYIFYSDVYFCLSHDKFSYIMRNFFINHGSDGRQFKFFFEFMQKLMNDLKGTELLNKDSFYKEKLTHPFEIINNLHEVPYEFYDRIQKERTDYAVNYDKYAKNLKNLLYYVWNEVNYAYLLSLQFDENPASVEDVTAFANELFETVLETYYKTDMLPTTPLLKFFMSQESGGMESTINGAGGGTSGTATSLFGSKFIDDAYDRVIDTVKKSNLITNETIAGMLDNQMMKTAATGFFKNMGGKVESVVQKNVVQKVFTLNFSRISKGLLFFWRTFGKSSELKEVALKGNSDELIDKFIEIIKKPTVNAVNKGMEKIPYASLVSSQNVGGILDTILGQVKNAIGDKKFIEDAPFTSASGAIEDFASTVKDAF
ncbi:MAG: hypothetical protein H6850_03975 [Alphaproteobacteria bacterium]|nr:MAG: hypothetical protein H6850_03975 [Alphaproteobacteria bacterium]